MNRCHKCAPAYLADAAGINSTDPSNIQTIWSTEKNGDKYAKTDRVGC